MSGFEETIFPHQEIIPGTVDRYLETLELALDDLEGKQILDIGSSYGGFAREVKRLGVETEITCLDASNFSLSTEPDGIKFVQANAHEIPIENNRFDYVLSVTALPQSAHVGFIQIEEKRPYPPDYIKLNPAEREKYNEQAVALTKQTISECLRVLKNGGQARFGIGIKRDEINYTEEDAELYRLIDKAVEDECKENHATMEMTENKEGCLYVIKKNEILDAKAN